jgi:hypothetical protein
VPAVCPRNLSPVEEQKKVQDLSVAYLLYFNIVNSLCGCAIVEFIKARQLKVCLYLCVRKLATCVHHA